MCWYTTQHRLEWLEQLGGFINHSEQSTATLILEAEDCIQLFRPKVMNSVYYRSKVMMELLGTTLMLKYITRRNVYGVENLNYI